MKILVLNTGSSSVKYQLFSMPKEEVICSGMVEKLGQQEALIHHKSSTCDIERSVVVPDHKAALLYIVDLLLDEHHGVVTSIAEINAVGHRVVHGGHAFKDTMEVNANLKKRIKEISPLAPLHNPSNLEGIDIAESIFKKAKQAVVFDTAFHQTIPEKVYKYAIPNTFLDKHHIRLYGFHGTSHKYVSERAAGYLGKDNSKIISIHLGNGCSMTAVRDGKSIDHSLGFAPNNGLIMGTRSGDIDHSLIFYLVHTLGYDLNAVSSMLQTQSGLIGLTGYSDLRDIEAEAKTGNMNCKLAIDMKVYRIKKYIGSYIAAMNGVDAIVFTAGIGENSDRIRQMVCSDMETFGIVIDHSKNSKTISDLLDVSDISSKVRILVIPTNEELEIARQTFRLFTKDKV